MSTFLFKAIGFFVVVGAIFFAGFFVGGGFATGAAYESQRDEVEVCLPVETTDDLDACLDETGDDH